MSTDTQHIPVLGLTGGIGSGKSTALAYLHELGAATISSDDIVHGLYSTAEVVDRIREHFGDVRRGRRRGRQPSGAGRHRLRRRGRAALARGPAAPVRALGRGDDWVEEQQKRRPRPALIVVEVPLLFETGFEQRFDHIMLITAPDDVRRRRVTAKLTDSEFRRRRAQQMPEDEKIRAQRLRRTTTRARARSCSEFVGRPWRPSSPETSRPWGTAPKRPSREAPRPRSRARWRPGSRPCSPRRTGSAPLFAGVSGGPSWYTRTVYPLQLRRRHPRRRRPLRSRPGAGRRGHLRGEQVRRARASRNGAIGLMQVLP